MRSWVPSRYQSSTPPCESLATQLRSLPFLPFSFCSVSLSYMSLIVAELTFRQRPCDPDSPDPARRRPGPIHGIVDLLLRQVPSTAIPRIHQDMVVLAAGNRDGIGLYPWLQDGRPIHLHERRRGRPVGSLGDPRHQEGSFNGELRPTSVAKHLLTFVRPISTGISHTAPSDSSFSPSSCT